MENYPAVSHHQPSPSTYQQYSHLLSSLKMDNCHAESVHDQFQDHKPIINIVNGYMENNPSSSTGNIPAVGTENEAKPGKGKGERKSKKPRYAFQTRSQVDILDDGYRWRKYGQKAVKNNKFPRSYYRCTYEGCNVKKQVQRLSMDEGVVVTTYDGMHSHSIDKSSDNFEHILNQMQIYNPI